MSSLRRIRRSFVDGVLRILDKNIPTRAEREHGILCFSQTGEDGILHYLLPGKGFYIDVGAHHPLRYSNTHMLYRRGWRGINIEPTPGTKTLFDLHRPGDLNLEVAVGRKTTKARFHVFEEGCYNTFDANRAKEIAARKISRLTLVKKIPVHPLAEICKTHLADGQEVHLLSVDAEGKDTEILKTHDWVNYRPRHVVVEHHGKPHPGWQNPCSFLRQKGYSLVSHTPFSAVFQDARQKTKGNETRG